MTHILEQDVAFLIRTSPHMLLKSEASALRLLGHHVPKGETMGSDFLNAESTEIESVEFFYACLLSLGAFGDELAEDLLLHSGWRGVVWGSFLCMLRPPPRALKLLQQAEANEKNQYILDAATMTLNGNATVYEADSLPGLMARLRALFAQVDIPPTLLRRPPSERERTIMMSEAEAIRQRYKKGGAQSAHESLETTLAHLFSLPYERWRALPDERRSLNTFVSSSSSS